MDEVSEKSEEVVVEEVEEVVDTTAEIEGAEVSLTEALNAEFDKQTATDDVSVETPSVTEGAEAEAVVTAEAEVVPPEHWSKQDQTAFMSMDDSGREFALRLETNAHKGIEEKSKELKQFRDAFEPFKHLVPPGVSEAQVIQQLLNAQSVLQNNPVEGLKWLARSYGVDEKQLSATDKTVPDADEYIDPEVRKLKEEVTQLKNHAGNQLLTAENNRKQAIFAEISQFKDAVDENDNVEHPHFSAVQGVMAGLLQSGRVTDMDAAYKQAVWAVPEYRDSVIETKAKEQADKLAADNTEAAGKAVKAAKTVNGRGSSPKPKTAVSIGDSLADNYEKSIRGEL